MGLEKLVGDSTDMHTQWVRAHMKQRDEFVTLKERLCHIEKVFSGSAEIQAQLGCFFGEPLPAQLAFKEQRNETEKHRFTTEQNPNEQRDVEQLLQSEYIRLRKDDAVQCQPPCLEPTVQTPHFG